MAADVMLLDTTYPDLSVESGILAPEGFSVDRVDGSSPLDVQACTGAKVIICGSRVRLGPDVMPDLEAKAIIRAGIGIDRIDLDAAAHNGVVVCNVPHYGTESVAQHTLALALAATRRLGEADRMVRRGEWGFRSTRPMHLPADSTAGVLGLGRIGTRVAELFEAVGFGEVIGSDPYFEDHALEQVSFSDLVHGSDVLSLHVPGRPDGSPVIGERELSQMKDGSVLVNTARGSLVDLPALAEGLSRGRPRVAALDVFATEPPDLTPFAAVEERLILSPHQAWYTEESQEALRRHSAEEAVRILKGDEPTHPVTRSTA